MKAARAEAKRGWARISSGFWTVLRAGWEGVGILVEASVDSTCAYQKNRVLGNVESVPQRGANDHAKTNLFACISPLTAGFLKCLSGPLLDPKQFHAKCSVALIPALFMDAAELV